MDSLGERLKASRLEQNYTIDQVARETMISRRYLEALEAEDFSAFPGETYLIGFLRNYGEYLGLDSNALINLYRNMKLQEQPIPMEELIHGKKKPSPLLIGAVFVTVAAALAVGIYFMSRRAGGGTADAPEVSAPERQESTVYVFEAETDTRWFEGEDEIAVPVGDRRYVVRISAIDRGLTLEVPGGTVRLEVGEARFLDLNLDNKEDVKIFFNDVDSMDETKRVNLQLTKASLLMAEDESVQATAEVADAGLEGEGEAPLSTEESSAAEEPGAEEAAAEEPGAEEAAAEEVASEEPPSLQASEDGRIVILEADAPRVFEVEISFRESCLLRYLLDGELRDQRFFQKSEEFLLDNVSGEVMLWISNAGALISRIEGREIKFGRVGQVVTKLIRWRQAEGEEKYLLEVVSAY